MVRCHQWLRLHFILCAHYVLTRLLTIFLAFKCHIELRDSTVKAIADEYVLLVVSMPVVEGTGNKD